MRLTFMAPLSPGNAGHTTACCAHKGIATGIMHHSNEYVSRERGAEHARSPCPLQERGNGLGTDVK